MEPLLRQEKIINILINKVITPKLITVYQKIIILLNLVSFAFVVSQPLFYILAMSEAQKTLRPASYIELRNLLDKKLQINLRFVYYATIFSNMLLVLMSWYSGSNLLLITSLIAMVSLIADMVLMFKGDIPVNKAIQNSTPENYPSDWKNYRSKGFFYYHRRQLVDIIGFFSLLTGAVFA
jgi:hypothetical protein